MSNPIDNLAGDQAELMRLLERGLGRAVLFVQGKDPARFRRVISYALMHDLSYDSLEQSRAEYMLDVVNATGELEYYAPYIREALRTITDGCDLEQLAELGLLLAKDGDLAASDALYFVVANRRHESGTSIGAEELIELDGMDGLAFVARHRIQPTPGDFYYGYAIQYVTILDEQMGKEASRAALNELALTDLAVARTLAEVEWFEQTLPERRKRPAPAPLPSFDKFRELLSAGQKSVSMTTLERWGKEADDHFTGRVAAELMTATEPRRLFRLLSFFRKRSYPGEPARLIELSTSEDQQVANMARIALSNILDSTVRDFAIKELGDPSTAAYGVDMLSRNFQAGDHELIMEALSLEMSPDDLHQLNYSVRDFYREHPSPAAKDALMVLCERLHCTLCRESVVERLMELGPLPEWMVEECRYDASLDLRRLVGA